jgi:hypothetical protein
MKMKKALGTALVALLAAGQAHAADCDSVHDAFNHNISTVNATLASGPDDPIGDQAWVDLQVNGEWLEQHNCNIDRKYLNKLLGYARQFNMLASLYRANDRLLRNH